VGAAGLLLMTPRLRHRTGPALRGGPLPVTATLLSLATHVALGLAIFFAATAWQARQPKMYVVNLVPAVAAVGSPQGRPSLPPRAEEAPPRVASRPTDLPTRETPRPAPAAPPDLPARAPSLPDRALPDRPLPPRAPGAPRASDKELPQIASTTPPAPGPTVTTPAPRAPETPAPSLGQRSGSLTGAGAVTVTASDFPFAWYIGAVQRKINERWDVWAQPGRQPVAVFAIGRDGRITGLAIEKSSGNSYYDQKALRAISDALPFPPLPAEYRDPVLTIHLEFNFSQDRG
jgi:periplasmic protein TonB